MKRPWGDEDRQRFADRDILRARTRPGKRQPGPDASEWPVEPQDDSGVPTLPDYGLRRLDGNLGASKAIPEPDDGDGSHDSGNGMVGCP
jgi:hypothetical protein